MADLFSFVCVADQEEVRRSVETNLDRSLPHAPYGTIKGGPIAVCGNGPSLREIYPDRKHPRMPIAALNGAWRTLFANGIVPDYVIAYDPHPRNAEWFIEAPAGPIYLLGSRMHPACFDILSKRDVRIWHCDGPIERDNFRLSPLVFGGPTVGLHGINLLAALGYRHFDLYGYDSSYSLDGAHHASPQDWGTDFPRIYSIGETNFLAAPWMAGQAQEFLKLAEANRKTFTVNVKSPGLLQELCLYTWGHTHNNRTLEALYDLGTAPGSFDFIWSLMNIENFRRAKGYRGVKVHFKPGPDGGFRPNEPINVGHAHKNGMMNNVVRPLLKFFDFEEIEKLSEPEYLTCTYSPRPTVDIYRADGLIPTFAPSAAAMTWAAPYKGHVTITLREAHYWPQRNSNVREWIDAAIALANRGEKVIFLRDTAKAAERLPVPFFETCPEASIDLDRRLALYTVAKMNLGVSNGPLGLCWATSTVPYLTIWPKVSGYPSNEEPWFSNHMGFGYGEQFPWRDPNIQNIVWADDTRANIVDAYLSISKRAPLAA